MSSRHRDREVRFEVIDNHLVRTVTLPGGKAYQHRCSQAAFTDVAHAVDESPREGRGMTMESLTEALGLPYTQVDVAMEFLKNRGVLEVRSRRSYRASDSAFEDAMCEFHALAHAGRQHC